MIRSITQKLATVRTAHLTTNQDQHDPENKERDKGIKINQRTFLTMLLKIRRSDCGDTSNTRKRT